MEQYINIFILVVAQNSLWLRSELICIDNGFRLLQQQIQSFKRMITSLFLTIPPGTTYEQLQNNLHFVQDFAGVTNWVMRFPRIIYSVDLKTKHTFNQNQVEIDKVVNPSLQQRWKYFVITKGDGIRYYCTAQTYYQKAPLKCRQSSLFQANRQIFKEFYVPKCLVLMSDMPYYKIQVNLLKVYRQLKKTEPIISHAINEGLYKVYLYLLENQRDAEWQNITVKQPNQSKKITPSTQFTFNYYINCCNEHKHGEAIFIQKSTNREVLHLYKLQHQSLYQICYIFHLPFSSNTLRIILSAILQQKQIIFASNNQNLAALIIQTLMRMILPFKWCYMYVPNLPTHLIEPAQESFMPYIVGIHKKNLSLIDTAERVVVYVEEDKVVFNGELHLFHQNFCEYLSYANNDSKNYLQWQKQIRIKSILLIHNILQNCFNEERAFHHQQQQMFLRQSTTSLAHSTATICLPEECPPTGRPNFKPSFSSAIFVTVRQTEHTMFIKEFVNSSMMFKNFKEDRIRGLTEETFKILQVPREHRKGFLIHNFNLLTTQAQYPARYDNQKKWIKYYERVNRSRRKFRFNRYSLNSLQQSNVSQSPFSLKYSTTNASMIGSSVRLGESRVLAQSTIFH